MPLYEYQCPKCERVTEKLAKHEDAPPPCASCGTQTVRLIARRTSFELRGPRWARDGYSGDGSGDVGGDDAA